MPKLENWSIVKEDSNPFLAPEIRGFILKGNIYNDNRFQNGSLIVTSTIQEINIKNRVARTRNTLYRLGEPSKNYLKWLKDNGKSLMDI